MKLYLVRHGQALSETEDPQRGLRDSGKKEIEVMAHFLKNQKISVDQIWHSGKKRAEQTAAIMKEILHLKPKLQERKGLNPMDDISTIEEELEVIRDSVMIVGHLPFIGKLCSKLLGNSEDKDIVHFRTGALACLKKNGSPWSLDYFLPPDIL